VKLSSELSSGQFDGVVVVGKSVAGIAHDALKTPLLQVPILPNLDFGQSFIQNLTDENVHGSYQQNVIK
jgi:hypothetical protein